MELGARLAHLFEGALGFARAHVDAADGVLDDGDRKPEAKGVEHALLDAVVGGEPRDEEPIDAAIAEELSETRVLEG